MPSHGCFLNSCTGADGQPQDSFFIVFNLWREALLLPLPPLRLFVGVRSLRVHVMKVRVLALHSPHKSSSSIFTLKVVVLQLLCPGCFLSHPPLPRLQALPLHEVSPKIVSSPPVGLTSTSYKTRQTLKASPPPFPHSLAQLACSCPYIPSPCERQDSLGTAFAKLET